MYKLTPSTKDYIWGGKKLFGYGVKSEKDKIAEAWTLSFHKDGNSFVGNNPVSEVIKRTEWGRATDKFEDFPVLIKLIDAADNLSVQVHPSDDYARKQENSFGKTEMWYVVEAEENAGLYVGFNQDVTKEQFASSINDGTVTELLNFFPVKEGDCFFIEAGTVHAIGKGCTIAEVQQNSNLTYRVFDFNRVGVDGKPRELHIEKAKQVATLTKYERQKNEGVLADCKYFTACLLKNENVCYNEDSFISLLVLSDTALINGESACRGDSFFLPAGEKATVRGLVLETYCK